MHRDAILTLPNALSLSRVAMAAWFVFAQGTTTRLILLVVAGATDFLDGWIARRRHQANRWGALLDPLTDRVFVFAALCSYLFRGEISTAQYFILLARDIATSVGFLVARGVSWLRPAEFQARWLGKAVTVLQLAALAAVLVAPAAVQPLIVAVAVGAVLAIVDYTLVLWRTRARA